MNMRNRRFCFRKQAKSAVVLCVIAAMLATSGCSIGRRKAVDEQLASTEVVEEKEPSLEEPVDHGFDG